jgi:hypothetical protein
MISSHLWPRLLWITIGPIAAGCGEDSAGVRSAAADSGVADSQASHAALADGGSSRRQTQLSTSATHTCALRNAALFCWGENFKGQLGTGDLVDSEKAVVASVAGMDVVQVAVSTGRSCVRRSTGQVACWGSNDFGQIGDGTRDDALTAVHAVGVDDAVQLALDDETTCVVRGSERRVACWGGSTADTPENGSLEPVAIMGLSDVVELRAGAQGQYCARLRDASVRCWSSTDGGWTAAADVPALAGARSMALAAPRAVCAIVGTGAIQCHNLESGKTVPLDHSAGHVRIVAAGSLAACAVDADSAWHCWNVLPPMLETVGSPRLEAMANTPLLDFVFSGFRICALRPNEEVACGTVVDWRLPELAAVEGLQD